MSVSVLLPISRFDEYEAKTEEWGVYQERLEQIFVANGISPVDENRKRAILLNSCGKQTYHLLRSLVGPSKPADTPYENLCETLQNHYNPRPTVTVQRYKFNTRIQQLQEDVSTFIAKLRELAEFVSLKIA